MALTIPCQTAEIITLENYIAEISGKVNVKDLESLAASAPLLRALANDRNLVLRVLNQQVENTFKSGVLPSAQSLFLGSGKDFYVRANIWPSTADVAAGRVYQDQFAYNIAHDHNFSFMTVSYLGPGYETDIYEYDYEKVEGYTGEPVDIRFLEKVKFAPGMVMLYRANKDAHIQYPPQELTITLNLMVSDPSLRCRDQFLFDLERKTISGYPTEQDSSKRVSIIAMAGYLGNPDTRELLNELAVKHPCRRTRLSAFGAMSRQQPAQAAAIWEQASRDPAALVSRTARERLATLEGQIPAGE